MSFLIGSTEGFFQCKSELSNITETLASAMTGILSDLLLLNWPFVT
jgi:hypothetical protein